MNFGDLPKLTNGELRKFSMESWVSNQAYVPRNLIAVVVRNLPPHAEGDRTVPETLRAILELHPQSITGLKTAFGPEAVEIFPTVVLQERYGRPIDKFFWWWYNKYREQWFEDEFPHDSTIDVMFIEPDPTHTVAAQAFFCYDMYPHEFSGLESKRDLRNPAPFPSTPIEPPKKGWWRRVLDAVTNTKTKPAANPMTRFIDATQQELWNARSRITVKFGCRATVGPKVDAAAQRILNSLNLVAANPYDREQFLKAIHGQSSDASTLEGNGWPEFDPAQFEELRYSPTAVDLYPLL